MASIQQRPSGKWRARYEDPDGTERSQHFDTKVAAEDFLATVRVKLRDGTWVDPMAGRRTFAEYARGWLDGQIHLRKSSRDQKRTILEGHLIGQFGDQPLAAIQRSDVQAWVRAQGATHAASTAAGHYTLLAQILRAAVDDRLLAHTPCWKISLPENDRPPIVVPTVEQIGAVVAAAPEHARDLVLAGAATGLRVSEMAGLTKDRVDFFRGTVRVDRQLVGTSLGRPVFGPPKTKASIRTLPVPRSFTEMLAAHLAEWPSEDVIFRTAHDAPWTRRTLTEEFRRWRTAAKQGFTWHGLRHHYASGLIHGGQSIKVVQERLGHASITETADTYGHLWPADEDATRAVVDDLAATIRRTADGLLAQRSRSQA